MLLLLLLLWLSVCVEATSKEEGNSRRCSAPKCAERARAAAARCN
jgi:hypothetical protein